MFAHWRQKSVTIATSLERSREEGRTEHAYSCIYPANLVNIGPVHYDLWDYCSRKWTIKGQYYRHIFFILPSACQRQARKAKLFRCWFFKLPAM